MNSLVTVPPLKRWQWIVLGLPIVGVVGFVLTAASLQIHQWRLNWIWAVVLIIFVGWRWLLARWLRSPLLEQAEMAIAELTTIPDEPVTAVDGQATPQRQQAEAAVRQVLLAAQTDVPPWENWSLFFQRCQTLVDTVARVYAPQAKRPWLNIYVPQAYGLIRGTVDDMDRWMQQLSPLLGQVTVGQAYEGYQSYQRLAPAAQRMLKVWNWAQWVLNPVAALARTATQGMNQQATQELVLNLGQIVREAALKALAEQAIALYSGKVSQPIVWPQSESTLQYTESLEGILTAAAQEQSPAQEPLNIILLGRTGAGKSSLINTLFRQDLAAVDVLPSTDRLQHYELLTPSEDRLYLWDTPGYEQIGTNERYRQQVLEQTATADFVILVTPATDPTLQIDLEFLAALRLRSATVPIVAVVTQVDRLRPLREWTPPYNWQTGDRQKEQNIREAVTYRQSLLARACLAILPVVTEDTAQQRTSWGIEALSQTLLDQIAPAQQSRLAQFLKDLNTRVQATSQVIERYVMQMGTQQGITALIKTPLLRFLSAQLTGSQSLGILLNQQIPLEQSPVLLGRMQMAYELFALLNDKPGPFKLELLELWPLITALSPTPDATERDAWALGQTLVEYWTHSHSLEKPIQRYQYYQTTSRKSEQSQPQKTS
jgi:hypothetical protein